MGRRGPLQAAFTIKEFRELTKLPGVGSDVLVEDIQGIDVAGKSNVASSHGKMMSFHSLRDVTFDRSISVQVRILCQLSTTGRSATGVL